MICYFALPVVITEVNILPLSKKSSAEKNEFLFADRLDSCPNTVYISPHSNLY